MGEFERPPQSVIDATKHTVTLLGGPLDGKQVVLSLGAEGFHADVLGAAPGLHTWWLNADGLTMVYDGVDAGG